MGRCKMLTDYEKGRIDQLKSLNWSNRQIAREINRDNTTVSRYIRVPSIYGSKKSSGRPKSLGKRTIKKVVKLATNKCIKSSSIKARLGLNVTSKTVRNYLADEGNLVYSKMQGKPPLKKIHKEKRMEMAFEKLRWTTEWHKVIFSDEKKFNLDGPDGNHYYWHHPDMEKMTYSKRVQGGGSAMIWIAFCYNAKTPVVFISETLKSSGYISMLNAKLVPFGRSILEDDYIFQQDNAPCHSARITQEWFESKGIDTLDWPARSPDLNPVENLFGILASKVYSDGKQYESVNQLKLAILTAWNEIDVVTLHKLVDSMPERMIQVIKSNGDSINY